MNALAEPWMEDLETHVAAAATRVTARLRARRRSRRIATLAVTAILIVGGGALAETTPFHPIAAYRGLFGAQRAALPDDAIPSRVLEQLQHAHLASVRLDQTRLVARFPGDARLYAAPGRSGLCFVYLEVDTGGAVVGCRLGNLTSGMPISFLTERGAGHPTVVTGLARDDVRSLSFTVAGVTRTVAVHHNAFWYRDPSGGQPPRSFVVHFRDGRSTRYPR